MVRTSDEESGEDIGDRSDEVLAALNLLRYLLLVDKVGVTSRQRKDVIGRILERLGEALGIEVGDARRSHVTYCTYCIHYVYQDGSLTGAKSNTGTCL